MKSDTLEQRGDDLEDDFVLDDTVALSGDEEFHEPPQLDDEDIFLEAADEPGEDGDAERDGSELVESTPNASGSSTLIKKRKRREKEKERKKRKISESENKLDGSIAAQPPHELSSYLNSMQVKSFAKLSTIELEDLRIPESSIVDTTTWTGPRTLDQVVDFIMKTLPSLHTRLGQKSKANGAPTLLYIAGSALRVIDLTRVLKDKKLRGEKGGEVAKLFAKHIKLAEHVALLQMTKVGAAVGTPGRLGQLLNETDALHLSAVSHIILDITYKDAKNRSLLDIPETRDELFKKVFSSPQVLKSIKEGKIQVVLF
ncbi:U3-containing 90S pre-ribosomal complex subunit-domain containing protein [Crassisporium funariophilum]|nr:U3-containing 90S pre-ribosomal complex subunit-domain containing protein [Crassisporium funariophilum]